MKQILFTLYFCVCALNLAAQNTKKAPVVFDKQDFEQKLSLAKWLYQYDLFASSSSDSVVSGHEELYTRLGEEWFCYQDHRKTWHAIYGDYEDGKYDYVFHYEGNAKNIKQKPFPKDSIMIMKYAKALHISHLKFDQEYKSQTDDIHFNHYIKRNPDKTFTVWYFPGFQKNQKAVYGGEVVYTLDSNATIIIQKESFFQDKLTSTLIDNRSRKIIVDYSNVDKPTLGSVFFMWTYRFGFPDMTLKTAKSISTLNYFKEKKVNNFAWKHELITGSK